jgi:hypothetical protein
MRAESEIKNLFSSWYSWKIAELALNNNHSLTIKAILFTQKQLFDWPFRLLNMNCIRKYLPCLLPKIYKKLIKNEMVLSGYINRSTYIVAKMALNNNHSLTIQAILFTQKQLFDWPFRLLNMNCIRKYFSTSFSIAIHKYAVFTSWNFSNNVEMKNYSVILL